MFAELITSLAPLLVAAVILVPLVLFLSAMLFEGVHRERWGRIRRATRKAFVTSPLDLPVLRARSTGAGGLGMRRVSAAPETHE